VPHNKSRGVMNSKIFEIQHAALAIRLQADSLNKK
jgi:hypothetical protein